MKRGRPSKYKKEYVELAYKFALLGLPDKKMAEFFEVSESTFNEWKEQHPVALEFKPIAPR
jgi:transposase-like protein